MSKNYADALRRKPPPVPQAHRPEPQKEAGAKRPRHDEFPPPSTNTEQAEPAARASVWGRPDAVSIKKPPFILKRPIEEPAPAPVIEPPPSKKSKKPRPTQMSLGDVMPKHVLSRMSKPTPTAPPPTQQAPQPMEVSNQEEFPSLSAGTAVPKPSLPAYAGWGKKAAVPFAKGRPPATLPKKVLLKQQSKQECTKSAASVKQPENKPSLLDFGAKQRTEDGREHDLIRLLKDGKIQQSQVKAGRQRITPRKKKFTTLKKKILQERLEAWRKLHPVDQPKEASVDTTEAPVADTSTCTVCLQNFADYEEVEDDDEYAEIVENFKEMAVKVGPIRDAFLHRQTSGSCPAFVWFETPQSAAAACACWNGLIVGGQSLDPVLLYPKLEGSGDVVNKEAWRKAVLSVVSADNDLVTDGGSSIAPATIILKNALSKDDFEDREHLEESLSYIRSLVEQQGTVSKFEAKENDYGGVVVVSYSDASVAEEAVAKFDGLLVSGVAISASLSNDTVASSKEYVVKLTTNDDLEDEDCLKESLSDIKCLAKKYGPLPDIDALKVDGGNVLVTYRGDETVARIAAAKLDGTVLGGNVLQASVISRPDESRFSNDASGGWVLLQHVLTEDDIADEECLEESIEDVKELASRYGKVLNVKFDPDDLTRVIRIEYDGGQKVARLVADKFNGMIIGGQTVAATTLSSGIYAHGPTSTAVEPTPVTPATGVASKPADAAPKPLYSGDKLIPERFAACKRVPKVVTSTGPRDYASLSNSEEVTPLLIEMLGELMRLQRRAIEDKNAKARRRIVMGLREVSRGIRAHKVKMVVMANNVDQYGAVHEKLREILDLARQEDVPVIFELNKRKLGKAVGKTIKVSVVGIQNADGAHQEFKKLAALAAKK